MSKLILVLVFISVALAPIAEAKSRGGHKSSKFSIGGKRKMRGGHKTHRAGRKHR